MLKLNIKVMDKHTNPVNPVNEENAVIKQSVRKKYGEIARQDANAGCCSDSCCGDELETSFVGEDYSHLPGYQKDADLNLGCGLPTRLAQIRPGDTVVDLGSGAGNDAFIALSETGPTGKVIGVDFTKDMIDRARRNAQTLGYGNVSFVLGDLEDIPLEDGSADVVVSNCVFNLVPNKRAAINETFRILRPAGHFSISDIVTVGEIPEELRQEAELYAGCVAGAIPKDAYVQLFRAAGFTDLQVQKEREIVLPDGILDKVLDPEKKEIYLNSGVGIYSINLFGKKG